METIDLGVAKFVSLAGSTIVLPIELRQGLR